jgi:tetratricopeptide (TPR) repeat protein
MEEDTARNGIPFLLPDETSLEDLYESAIHHYDQEEYQQAVEQLRQIENTILAIQQRRSSSSRSEFLSQMLFATYFFLGNALRCMGQYIESIDALQNALKTATTLGTIQPKSYVAISLCHQHLATSLRYRGDYNAALDQYQIAITIRQQKDRFGGSSGLALSLVGCATIDMQLGNYPRATEQAQEYLERAMAIAVCMKPDAEELGHVLYQSGLLLMIPPPSPEQREHDWETSAWQTLERAKTIFQNAQNVAMTAVCQREMAMVLFFVQQEKGNHELPDSLRECKQLLDQALADLQSLQYPTVDLAATHTARGIVCTAEQDYENATMHLEVAESILVMRAPRSVEFAKLCMAMGQVHLEQRDPENALGRYQLAKSIYMHHNITTTTSKNPIVQDIETTNERLAWTVAEHDERQTGIPTAVARMIPTAAVTPPMQGDTFHRLPCPKTSEPQLRP